MNDRPSTQTQDLREAFTSIISMMLGLLRAQGWRGLLHLPEIVMVVFLLRSISKRFAALIAACPAGTLLPATPAPGTAAPQWPAVSSRAAATLRVRAHQAAPHRRRPQPARAASTRVRAPLRQSIPTLLPRPLTLVRATAEQKIPFWPPCLGTPNSLR